MTDEATGTAQRAAATLQAALRAEAAEAETLARELYAEAAEFHERHADEMRRAGRLDAAEEADRRAARARERAGDG